MIAPGIYPDLCNHDYHADTSAISSSSLRVLRKKTPFNLFYAKHNQGKPSANQKRTENLHKGSAFHTITLQPEKWDEDVIVVDYDLKRPAEREEYKHLLDTSKKIIVREQWMANLQTWAQCVRDTPDAMEIIEAAKIEQSIFQVDQGVEKDITGSAYHPTGIYCKIRPDLDVSHGDLGFLADLKSAADGNADRFSKEIHNRFYHGQAAFYLDIRNMEAGFVKYKAWKWIVLEKGDDNTPPMCAVYWVNIEDEMITTGRKIYRKYLEQFAYCQEHNYWPGYRGGQLDIQRFSLYEE